MAKTTTPAKTGTAPVVPVNGPAEAAAAARLAAEQQAAAEAEAEAAKLAAAAEAAAQADAQALQAEAQAAAEAALTDEDDDFPVTVKVLNLSGHEFSDTVTGKLISTGTEVEVTLQTEEQSDSFYQALYDFAKFLPDGAVTVNKI